MDNEKETDLLTRMGDYALENYQDIVDGFSRMVVLSGTLEIGIKIKEEDRTIFSNDVEIQDGYIVMKFNLGPKNGDISQKKIEVCDM